MAGLSARNLIGLRDVILIGVPTFMSVTRNHQVALYVPFPIQGSSMAESYLSPD